MSDQPLDDKKTYRLPPSQAFSESSSDSAEPDLIHTVIHPIHTEIENKETSSCIEEVYDRKPTSTDKTVTQSKASSESLPDSESEFYTEIENKETSSCIEEVYDRKPTITDKTVTQSEASSESPPDSESQFDTEIKNEENLSCIEEVCDRELITTDELSHSFKKLTLESVPLCRTDNESGSDSCSPWFKRESSCEFSSSTEIEDSEQRTGACSPYLVSENESSSYASSDSSTIEVPMEEQITEYILQQIMFEEVVKAHRDLKYGTCNKYTIINKQIVRCGHDAYEKVLLRNYLHKTNQPILPYIEDIRLKCSLCKAECSHKTLHNHMRNKCPKRSKIFQVSSESMSKENDDSLNEDADSVCDENEDSYEKVYDFRGWRDGSRDIERDTSPKSPTVQSDSSREEDSKDCGICDDISMKLKDLFTKETKIDPACGDNSETPDLVCEAVVSKSPKQAAKTQDE